MSHTIGGKGASGEPEPTLAQMLFAAINEHEAALARVARLLHDDVSQVLSAVGLQLDALRMDFREQAPGIENRATEIQTMLEQVIGQLRDISNEFNPSIVERAGLQFALERLAGKFGKSFGGVIRLHFDPTTRVPTQIGKAFYKIAECAMDISAGREGCSLIELHVRRAHGEFLLEVHDNGAEYAAARPHSLDRLMMDYHASENGVTLDIVTPREGGNLARASYPVPVMERHS